MTYPMNLFVYVYVDGLIVITPEQESHKKSFSWNFQAFCKDGDS